MLKRGPALAAAALVLAVYGALTARFWFVYEDAFISFRYARNWAGGHGLRYNLGENEPVEGYSNLLWVALCALFDLTGLDMVRWAPATATLLGVVLLAVLFRTARRQMPAALAGLVTLTVASSPAFAAWASSGMETMLFALLFLMIMEQLLLQPDRPSVVGATLAGIAITLCRVEGVVWGVGIPALAALIHRSDRDRLRTSVQIAALVLVGVFTHRAICWFYYGDIVANTVRAKVSMSAVTLASGARYVIHFWLTLLTPILPVLLLPRAIRHRGGPGAGAALCFVGVYVYSVAVGGDWMLLGRFLMPSLAIGALLTGWALAPLWNAGHHRIIMAVLLGGAALNVAPAANLMLVPRAVRRAVSVRKPRVARMNPTEIVDLYRQTQPRRVALGKRLAGIYAPTDSLVSPNIGVIGYYSDLFIYDVFSLVSRQSDDVEIDLTRPPGHQKKRSARAMLVEHPTLLDADLFDETERYTYACDMVDRWALPVFMADYAPNEHPTPADRFVLTIERWDDREDRMRRWESWVQQCQPVEAPKF
ncbi:MAG: hypothetical protein AAFV53_28420 [Myxococcota bacterium]